MKCTYAIYHACVLNVGTLSAFFDFMKFFCSVRTKLYSSEVVKSLVRAKLASSPAFGCLCANFEPKSYRFSSLKRACFELNWCRFRAQIVAVSRLGIQSLFGDEPTFSPRKTAGRVRLGFVQIDQSGIRLPRLSRRNNYINYLCLHFRIHFTFLTWYLFLHILRDVLCYRHLRLLRTTEINRLLG